MITIIFSIIIAVALAVALWMKDSYKWDDTQRTERYNASNSGSPYERKPYVYPKRLLVLPLGVVTLGIIFSAFTIISAGHEGVQTTLGQVNMQSLNEGLHFINPVSNVSEVSVRVEKADLKNANAGTKDLQVVHTDIVVNYRLDGAKVAHMYKESGLDLTDKILMPAVSESFKAVTAHYDSEELITKRDEVSRAIHEALQSKVSKYGLIVSEISLVNFGFSAEYQAAIERKVIATQQKLKAEQDLSRIVIEADQRIAKAKGEAESIRIQAQAIQSQGGKDYVQLQAIARWDGKLPTYMMGNSAMPMINLKD